MVMPKCAGLVACLAIVLLFNGCIGGQASGPDVLSPRQVESSMVGKVVEVKGRITSLVENPGGLGGVYLNLGDNEAEVGVRVQQDIWQSFDENKKAEFKKGRTITAEGVLFQAGKELVIILGKYSLSSNTTSNW
jgi:hypothetical protein